MHSVLSSIMECKYIVSFGRLQVAPLLDLSHDPRTNFARRPKVVHHAAGLALVVRLGADPHLPQLSELKLQRGSLLLNF